jgi:hypothetical protein
MAFSFAPPARKNKKIYTKKGVNKNMAKIELPFIPLDVKAFDGVVYVCVEWILDLLRRNIVSTSTTVGGCDVQR